MKTVHIYGGATSSTPFPPHLPGEDKWGINNLWCKVILKPRYESATHWFDLHTTEHIQKRKHNMYHWLCKLKIPVYRWEVDPNMPTSVRYPREEVFDTFKSRFFCSTFDWLMALAILQRYERIHLYGWRMAQLNYTHQVKSGQFWVRKAVEAGVVIENHSKSSLFTVKHTLVEPDLSNKLMYGLETTDRSKIYSHRWA